VEGIIDVPGQNSRKGLEDSENGDVPLLDIRKDMNL